MQFRFTKFKVRNSPYPHVFRPMLDINFFNETRAYSTRGLIDSGADSIMLNLSIAKALNIDAKSGAKGETVGVGNIPVPVYYHNIDMEIANFPDSRISIEAGFIDSGSVGVLLGRRGFFENFKIIFEMYDNAFYIEKKP